MPESAWLAASFLANVAGVGWLALTLDPHWRQVRGDKPSASRRRRLRALGGAALAGSLLATYPANHASM